MGIRVTVPSIPTTPGLTGSTVADSYVGGIRPMQGAVNAMGNVGGMAQNSLTHARSALDAATISPMSSRAELFSIHTSSLSSNVGIALNVGPPVAVQSLSHLASSATSIGSAGVGAFNMAKQAVTGTNGVIALALMAACLLIATVLQGAIAKLTAAALRMQRTILAQLDAIRKAVVDLVQGAIDALMETLPDCPQTIKDVIAELKSILGKASTIVAAITSILRDVAACMAIGAAVAALVTQKGDNGVGSLFGITSKSRELAQFDIKVMKREFEWGIELRKDEMEHNRNFYHTSNYLSDETTNKAAEARREAEEARRKVEDLIRESEERESSPNPDDPEYQEALKNIKKDLENIEEDMDDAEQNLLDETLRTIDTMTDDAQDNLNTLLDDLNRETDAIGDSIDEIFEGLELIAQDFDSPEVQEQLATSCTDTEFRRVLDEQG